MKRLYAITLAGVLSAAAGVATAATGPIDSTSPSAAKLQTISVLVHVNSAGKVTDISPATKLSASLTRLLRQNVTELVTGPAIEKGRPIASQFVMNLTLQTTPRSNGQYDAKFAYVSTKSIPPGSWYWSNQDGRRLTLVNRATSQGNQKPSNADYQPRDAQRSITPDRPQPPPQPIQKSFNSTPVLASNLGN